MVCRIAVATLLAVALFGCSRHRDDASPRNSVRPSVLLASTPAQGAVLAASPEYLRFTFRKPVRLVELELRSADGKVVPIMVFTTGQQTDYAVPVPMLTAGKHTVAWRAASARGAAIAAGKIRFSVR